MERFSTSNAFSLRSAFAQFVDHRCSKKISARQQTTPCSRLQLLPRGESDDHSDDENEHSGDDDDEDELPDCQQNEAVNIDNLLEKIRLWQRWSQQNTNSLSSIFRVTHFRQKASRY